MDEPARTLQFMWWIALDASDLALWAWPVTAAVVLVALAGLVWGRPLEGSRFRALLPKVAATYLMPIALLAVGALLRYERHGPPSPEYEAPSAWFGFALWTPLVVHAVIVVVAVCLSTGVRVRTTAILLPSLWLSCCTLFPAGFAIAGASL